MKIASIPDGLKFSDLGLQVEPVTQRLLYLPSPLGRMCLANGIDPEQVIADEDRACKLICCWYVLHLKAGGNADSAIEAIMRRITAAMTG